jgi:hypothetical protein
MSVLSSIGNILSDGLLSGIGNLAKNIREAITGKGIKVQISYIKY